MTNNSTYLLRCWNVGTRVTAVTADHRVGSTPARRPAWRAAPSPRMDVPTPVLLRLELG